MWHISSSFDRKAKFLSTFWFQLITFTTHYKCANWRDVVVFTWLLNYNFSPVSCSLDNSNTIYYLELLKLFIFLPHFFLLLLYFAKLIIRKWLVSNDNSIWNRDDQLLSKHILLCIWTDVNKILIFTLQSLIIYTMDNYQSSKKLAPSVVRHH